MIRYDCKACQKSFESEDKDALEKIVQEHKLTTGHTEFTVSTSPAGNWSNMT